MRTRTLGLFILFFILFTSLPGKAQYYRHYRSNRWAGYGPRRPYYFIPFGGFPYYYSDGFNYRPYGGFFNLAFPGVGIHVHILPLGYRTIYYRQMPYYYHRGVFYYGRENDYEVVEAPIGAEVPELPSHARVTVINNQKFYELNGSYFKEVIHNNGELWYQVVGKDGRVDTDGGSAGLKEENYSENKPENSKKPDEGTSSLTTLPEHSKLVVIHHQKLFMAPDGTFYEEVTENNQIRYKIAGK